MDGAGEWGTMLVMGVGGVWAEITDNEGLSKVTVVCVRVRQACKRSRWWLKPVLAPLSGLAWAWTALVIGADIPASVAIGPGVRFAHGGRGIVLHHTVSIGAGVMVYHNVTVGVRGTQRAAVIGDGVYIGCGASILGDIQVGHGARIGAMTCVLGDVPAGSTVVGVAGRILPGVAPEHAIRTVERDDADE